jgi:hypothetical protein
VNEATPTEPPEPVAPLESAWARRLRRSAEATIFLLGVMLLAALSLPALLAWAKSPQGLNQPEFSAWLVVLLLAIGPVAMLRQAGDAWRRGYRAPKAVTAVWVFVVLGIAVQWGAGASWAEIAFRPVVVGVMLWFQRPADPPPIPVHGDSGNAPTPPADGGER